MHILALFGRGCLFLNGFARCFNSCSWLRPWVLRVATLPNVSALLGDVRRASMEGAVKVFSDLANGLLMAACLLGVELLTENLNFFDSHHSLACTVGVEPFLHPVSIPLGH